MEAGLTRLTEEADATRSTLQQLPIRLDALSLGQLRPAVFEASLAALREELRSDTVPASLAALADDLRASRDAVGRLAVSGEHQIGQLNALVQKIAEVEISERTALERLDLVTTLLRRYWICVGDDVAVRTDHGYVLLSTDDEALVIQAVDNVGRLEPGTQDVLLALLAPGSSYVDVGANVGLLCLPAARRVSAEGSVIALEPAPRTAALLRRTMTLNGLADRVTVIEAAAGAEEGRATLHLHHTSGWNTLVPGSGSIGEVDVAVRPLDSIIPPGRRVDVVKVDAEGYELHVLRGMGRVIADNPRLALVAEFGPSHIRRTGESLGGWLAAFRDHGMVPWEIEEATGRLRPLREAGLGAIFSINLLFLRDDPAERPGLRLP
jgi:FkbM family methyltransferase